MYELIYQNLAIFQGEKDNNLIINERWVAFCVAEVKFFFVIDFLIICEDAIWN